MVISISAILRHICTPNVSEHVLVRTVVHKNVYDKHMICISKSGQGQGLLPVSCVFFIALYFFLSFISFSPV